jgi:uncharacterized protein
MFLNFFYQLRQAKVPVTTREYLTFLGGMENRVAQMDLDEFYYLGRTCLVKNEKHYDRYDRVFGEIFKGLESMSLEDLMSQAGSIPEEWLRSDMERMFTPEELSRIEALGGLEKLMEAFKERLDNQDKRHEGGNKNIGTKGASAFGANGFNPEAIRIGQDRSRKRGGVKVWDRREFRNLDDNLVLGTRNIKVALRRLRQFIREGAQDEFDLEGTIQQTANNGYLDLQFRPEKRNRVKVLLFFDVGGSMDPHIQVCEELFSAARSELKNMEYFYFHNFLYDSVWKDNRRRREQKLSLWDVIHKYGSDYKVIIIGDASMSPYEIIQPGGSVEQHNDESGLTWFGRMDDHFRSMAWFNPEPEQLWATQNSTRIVMELMHGKMYPLTLSGLDRGLRSLAR